MSRSRPVKNYVVELPDKEKEFLAMIKVGKDDPVFFSEEVLGVKLHDGQKLWLWITTRTQIEKAFALAVVTGYARELMERWKMPDERSAFWALFQRNPEFKRNTLVPSNRWGKTVVTSIKHLWYNYYKKGVRGDPRHKAETRCGTLNLSPHSNQAEAGYQYINDILTSQLVYIVGGQSYRNDCKIGDFLESSNKMKRQHFFKNGTSYRAVPTGEDQASSLAGTPYLYISYDECAQSLHLQNELPAKIMSRLIDYGGPLDLVSTPEVDRPSHQYFYHLAKLGLECQDGWYTLLGKITDNVFLNAEEREKIGESIRQTDPNKYRQVMFGEFITTGKKMFDNILIERLWDGFTPAPVMHDHKYILACDWGFADTGDPTVFYVVDYTQAPGWQGEPKYRVCYREAIRGGSPIGNISRARILQREWNGATFVHDAANMGGVIIKKMLREIEMSDIYDFSGGGGHSATQKLEMLFALLLVFTYNRNTEVLPDGKIKELNPEFGRLRSYHIPELEEQLGNYQYNPEKGISDKKIPQDEVMALGMAIWYLEKKLNKNKVQMMRFNPLGNTVQDIFQTKSSREIKVRSMALPEKVIF